MAAVTLESLILSLNLSGWRLGSLCQLETGWYACLIDDEGFVHKASGETIDKAVMLASEEPSSGRLYDQGRAALEAQEVSDKIDLASLGLLRKREPLKRRF